MGEIFTHAAAQLSLTYLSEPGKQTGAGCNAHYRGSCNDPNSQWNVHTERNAVHSGYNDNYPHDNCSPYTSNWSLYGTALIHNHP